MRAAAAAALLAFALAAPALGASRPSEAELEAKLVCPTCHDDARRVESPVAQQMKLEIRRRIAQGWTKSQITGRAGRPATASGVLGDAARRTGSTCSPGCCRSRPIAVGAVALGVGRLVLVAHARPDGSRNRDGHGSACSPELERRVDEELPASMLEKLPVAFLAGLVSVMTPCVLPLVPGYLSAVSAVDVDTARRARRGHDGSSREHAVHHRLHGRVRRPRRRRCGDRERRPEATQTQIAGFVLIVIGLAFVGLLPVPERARSLPGCCSTRGATARGLLLGGAFAVCAAPCIGTVLASILVLAARPATIARGVLLLVPTRSGSAAAFVARGHRVRARDGARSAGCARTTS